MSGKRIAPFGAWKSPVTSDLVARGSIRLGQAVIDGTDLYWVELRPQEGGRYALVRRDADGAVCDVLSEKYNVRTRVHEYGGGAYTVVNGTVYFSNYSDQKMYRKTKDGKPEPVTGDGAYRYADAVVDLARNRIICVREDHTESDHNAVNTIVTVDLDDCEVDVLVGGGDFYSTPRLSPDGHRISWLTWNHPNMPWDGTELWTADLDDDGRICSQKKVAGGADESVFQPEWSPGGILYFVSDRTGWWNLYRYSDGSVEPVCEKESEFGVPQWQFQMRTYAIETDDDIVCIYREKGRDQLARLDVRSGGLTDIETSYTNIADVHADTSRIVVHAGSPTEFVSLVEIDSASGEWKVLRRSAEVSVDPAYMSPAESIEFPTENGLTAYAHYYAPRNAEFRGPENEMPPLVVKIHGGPTAAASTSLSLKIQFWTTRGFAVVDVDYGGSTGYGREYRGRLKGQWGIVDVDDCVNAARFLVGRGLVDGMKMAITGGSAGGYTTLCALTFYDVFSAGASRYGVSDPSALAEDTHKFEARYLDSLIGPYPERRDLYDKRAPIRHTDGLSCPLIVLQGLEDAIVPPNQAERIVDAVKSKGIPVAYLPFEGEQHGFRQSENIKRALDAELYFYSKVFGFVPADEIEPVEIFNLDES